MPKSKHLLVVVVGVVVFLLLLLVLVLKDNAKVISAATLENALQKNLIIKLWEKDEYLYAQAKDSQVYKILRSQVNPTIIKAMPIDRASTKWLAYGIATLLMLVIAAVVVALVQARKSRLNITPINATALRDSLESTIVPLHSSMRFSDVAGIDEVKAELLEIVDFLKYPQKYQRFGVNLPKGVLLSGVPGVGKTLLAKALAGESGVPFFYQSGSSFVEMYVGVGARRVRELFSRAKASAPCIIFIDEIDAIGKARKEGSNNSERESTLNQLLVEMDGFSDNSGVVVLAATNHIDALDPALLRSGRFDRKLFIELPNKQEREQILSMYLASKPNTLAQAIPQIASETSGFSGASLAGLVNEAALNAIRNQSPTISKRDFDEVYSKIHSGLKRLPLLESSLRDVYAIYHSSKLLYALHNGLIVQKATLFETLLTQSLAHTLSHSELLKRVGFYLVGDRAVRAVFKDSFGVFGEDYQRACKLVEDGQKLGLVSAQENLPSALVFSSSSSGIEAIDSLASFVVSHKEAIFTIAAVLLQEERLEIEEGLESGQDSLSSFMHHYAKRAEISTLARLQGYLI